MFSNLSYAKDLCESHNLRLCTTQEMFDNCGNVGCDVEYREAWTSIRCDQEYSVVQISPAGIKCVDAGNRSVAFNYNLSNRKNIFL